jgi:glycosyltransferase involved in cell wall biosynthesis
MMKIAIIGFRGIPAKYGGYETFIEELAPRLVAKGHQVTVYGRSNIIKEYRTGDYYKGVKLVILPTISHKYLDTVFHTFLSVIHCFFQKYDIVFMLNAANSIFAFIPKLTGKKVVLNVDGIERLRKKWGWAGKLWYKIGEYFATVFPDVIVSDAEVIRKYYLETYKKESVMIPYGANIENVNTKQILDRIGVRPNEYILYVSRLEPENNAHIVIEAFKLVKSDKKLIIVGDAPYAKKYKSYLKELAKDDPRIIFTGFVFGKGYKELQSNAYCYVQATEVGGTHPALLEAMGFGNCVIVNGTPENIEVVGDAGFIYKMNDIKDLARILQYVIDNPDITKEYREKARNRIRQNYSWEIVANQYEKLFASLLNNAE